MPFLLILAFLLAAPGVAVAQSVEGTVRDSSGAVIAAAAVEAVPEHGGDSVRTQTNGDGQYALQLDPLRRYVLRVWSEGFTTFEALVMAQVSSPLVKDVILGVPSFSEDVSVAARLDDRPHVATRLGLRRRETPASVDVVTQEVLQARGADTASTSMRGVTGVTSSLRPGASAVFSMRGFIENSIGIMFNGVRVQSSTITMRNYDAFNFDRVEVLRGPASVLHGEGLSAGAINFVRRQPHSGRQSVEALFEAGDAGRVRFGAAAAGGLGDRSSYTVSFTRNQFDTHVRDTSHEYRHLTGALQSSVGRVTIGVEGDYLDNDVDDPYWGTPLVGGGIDESLRGENYNRSANNRYRDQVSWGRVTAAASIGSRAGYAGQVFLYHADRDWRNSYGFEFQPATSQVLRRAVENLAYDHRLWGTRHEITAGFTVGGRPARVAAGADLSLTDFSSPRSYGARVAVAAIDAGELTFDAPARLDDRRADLRQAAAFAEVQIDPIDKVKVVAGGRAGTLTNEIARPASNVAFSQEFSPRNGRVGVVVTPHHSTSLYAQYATGSEPVEALLILGPAERAFGLAHSSMVEGGVKAGLAGGRADVTAAVYRIRKRDLTTTDPIDSTRTIQIGRQSSTGVELSLTARPADRWLLEANVAALNAQYDLFFQGAASRNGNLPPNVPELVLNVGGVWRPIDAVEVGAWITHVGRRTADTTAMVFQPAYTLTDPFVRVAAGRRIDLTLRVRNAFDRRYVEWATQAFGVTNVYFGEPRRVVLSARVRL
jgi:iron complex outermembrane receptor protein